MGIADRLAALEKDSRQEEVNKHVARSTATEPSSSAPASPGARSRSSALEDIKRRAVEALFGRLGTRINDSSITEVQLREFVRAELTTILEREEVQLSPEDRRILVREIEDDALGLGPVQRLLDDESVTEIMVNNPEQIYVERGGRLQLSSLTFESELALRRVIERIVARVGRRIDESSPLVDARLADGSRVNAIIPPLAVRGSSLTIRKFAVTPLSVNDLIRFGSMSQPLADLLSMCVLGEMNMLVSGGTGTGKTTLLNVLSSFIPGDQRIVTVEDAVELQLQQDHVVQLESRPPNIEGRGEVTIRDLVRNSLRMRPDRIVVGECRGGEALDMLQAMNTGHDGSLTTLHANSPRDAITRLETLVLMAGVELPLRAVREQIGSAIDVIVQITRLRNGSRMLTHVTELLGMEDGEPVLNDIVRYDFGAGYDADGTPLGRLELVGDTSGLAEKLLERGVKIPPGFFERLEMGQ